MALKDEIAALANFCVHLRSVWRHYEILFEEGELRRKLLHRIAPTFFGDLNQVLVEQLVLQICRLTDPATTTKGRTNLTLDYISQKADFSADSEELAGLTALRDSIKKFRSKIVPARNRLIGHLDREAVMAGQPLGGADEADWHQFWEDLDQFLYLVQTRVNQRGSFHLNEVGMISDADSVVKALKESTYFHHALDSHALTQQVADIAFSSEFADA